ncbi:MAG: alpha/beta hydrolase [Longimicrobiales bacterium]|nr:alpha/beta hydrolase [Longimicrobiales bacterium]
MRLSRPFFFGGSERRLFGLYTPPDGPAADRGMVLCNPWGPEALRAHRSCRFLAESLARNGVHVLRFDFFGTGDSGGDGRTGGLDGWIEDAATAILELRTLTAARRMGIAGLRLGAAVAVAAGARDRSVRSIVLWDPVWDGGAWLDELGSSPSDGDHGARVDRGAESSPGEVAGFPLPAEFRRESAAIDAGWYGARARGSLLTVESEPSVKGREARAMLEAAPAVRKVEYRVVPGPLAWLEEEDFGAGAVPVSLLEEVVSWVG